MPSVYVVKESFYKLTGRKIMGAFRDATAYEMESVYEYIKSISKPTGVNFFDLLEE